MPFRLKRVLRLTIFSLALGALALDVGLGWLYVSALAAPGCQGTPAPLAGWPAPEEVRLPLENGARLRAWYYPSTNGAAVVLLGGQGGALGNALPPAEPLLRAGYGILQLDTRACASPPTLVTLGYREAEDAAAGAAFLGGRPEVQPGRIGVFGFSMGGVAAIRAAARQPGFAAVVAEGGFFNLGADFVEPGSKQSLARRTFLYTLAGLFWLRTGANPWQISPVDDLPALAPRPVLLIYGEHEAQSGRAAVQFAAAGEPKTLWLVPGGSHGSNYAVAPAEYARRLVAFFDQALAPAR